MVFTYLQNMHGERLARFEQRLAADTGGFAAWLGAFPDLPTDKLEVELRHWLTSGSHRGAP